MLRICLTLSAFLGLQVAGTGADDPMAEACKSVICPPTLNVTAHNGYEEVLLPMLKFIFTFVDGMDLTAARNVALNRFFDYSRFDNDADTIVPISAPWSVYVPLENGTIIQRFSFFISLPLQVQSPPASGNTAVNAVIHSERTFYVRTFEQTNGDYGQLANEFKKDLENDQQSFHRNYVYIRWFNTRGLVQIAFRKN